MSIQFYKYQGAGNDFVIVDDRNEEFDRSNVQLVNFLCDRRFGIGADGLMLLRNKEGYDFEMVYYNADGNEGSMCGNGGRCIVAFAYHQGIIGESCHFIAVDGPHDADVINHKGNEWVSLKMIEVNAIEQGEDFTFMDTGSPHYVSFKPSLGSVNVVEEGRKVRYNDRFAAEGTNVNFIEMEGEVLNIRTYERGVEDETLACGTGVTAAVLTAFTKGATMSNEVEVKAKGGDLKVKFEKDGDVFKNIWLQGPAEFVFKGEIDAGV